MTPNPNLNHRSAYCFWASEQVRFGDLDPLGHVNNTFYTVYFETCRIAFFIHLGLKAHVLDAGVVIARQTIDFRSELLYPAKVDIGLAVLKIGTSSFTLVSGIFNGDTCHALAESVLVRFDTQTRKSKPLQETERTALSAYNYKDS